MQLQDLWTVLLMLGCLCSAMDGAAAARAMPATSACDCAGVQQAPVCAGGRQFPNPCAAQCAGCLGYQAVDLDGSCTSRRALQSMGDSLPALAADTGTTSNTTITSSSNGSSNSQANRRQRRLPGAKPDERLPDIPDLPDLCTCSGMYRPVCTGDDFSLKFSNICFGKCAGYKGFKRAGPDGACPPLEDTPP